MPLRAMPRPTSYVGYSSVPLQADDNNQQPSHLFPHQGYKHHHNEKDRGEASNHRSLNSSGSESVASTGSNNSAAEMLVEELQAKYDRLNESYRKLQRNNNYLEEKLLIVNDKFQADKNILTRDLASQTQKVVEAKLTIQQLHRENHQLRSDLKVALNSLQVRPSSFVPQKISSLPHDLQNRVRQYSQEKEDARRGEVLGNGISCYGGQRITVAVPSGLGAASGSEVDSDSVVSAAILAKVLEERENERQVEKRFCIDIGTQTHGWMFPDIPNPGGTRCKCSASSRRASASPSKGNGNNNPSLATGYATANDSPSTSSQSSSSRRHIASLSTSSSASSLDVGNPAIASSQSCLDVGNPEGSRSPSSSKKPEGHLVGSRKDGASVSRDSAVSSPARANIALNPADVNADGNSGGATAHWAAGPRSNSGQLGARRPNDDYWSEIQPRNDGDLGRSVLEDSQTALSSGDGSLTSPQRLTVSRLLLGGDSDQGQAASATASLKDDPTENPSVDSAYVDYNLLPTADEIRRQQSRIGGGRSTPAAECQWPTAAAGRDDGGDYSTRLRGTAKEESLHQSTMRRVRDLSSMDSLASLHKVPLAKKVVAVVGEHGEHQVVQEAEDHGDEEDEESGFHREARDVMFGSKSQIRLAKSSSDYVLTARKQSDSPRASSATQRGSTPSRHPELSALLAKRPLPPLPIEKDQASDDGAVASLPSEYAEASRNPLEKDIDSGSNASTKFSSDWDLARWFQPSKPRLPRSLSTASHSLTQTDI